MACHLVVVVPLEDRLPQRLCFGNEQGSSMAN